MAKMDWERANERDRVRNRGADPIANDRTKQQPRPKKKPFRQCEAITSKGKRCLNGAMRGHDCCGPHVDSKKTRTPKPTRPQRPRPGTPERAALGQMIDCPGCGLHVHVAGKFISYHAAINGCEVSRR